MIFKIAIDAVLKWFSMLLIISFAFSIIIFFDHNNFIQYKILISALHKYGPVIKHMNVNALINEYEKNLYSSIC